MTMIGLTNHIKVIVIRTAAGVHGAPVGGGCVSTSATYSISGGRVSLKAPITCSNEQFLYDPAGPRKVINIMNVCGAPSSDFFVFDRSNLTDPLDLQRELESGAEVICLWKPLFALSPNMWLQGLNQYVLPDKVS